MLLQFQLLFYATYRPKGGYDITTWQFEHYAEVE